ncbi:CBS domain-containing protein [Dendrosporobacter quercicolus]|uniref:CBS domain-containing protein n=2 Tax=Dendrosporobacter quercicolus TaxID=146817 RepID=A0A1G9Q3X8_9FIRM|nr:CBS domain-containing protein [Dendrosporobacter quercicolus]
MVKQFGPITGTRIAEKLSLSRAALRSDLAILTMSGLLGARPRVGYYHTGKKPTELIAGIIGNIRVADVQSRPIVIRETCSVYDAIVAIFTEDVGTIVVVSDGGFIEGIISRKDLLKAAMGGKNINELPVTLAMTRMPNIILAAADEPILRAAKKLISHQVDSLPVVEMATVDQIEKFKVVGRITKTNITQLFVNLADS